MSISNKIGFWNKLINRLRNTLPSTYDPGLYWSCPLCQHHLVCWIGHRQNGLPVNNDWYFCMNCKNIKIEWCVDKEQWFVNNQEYSEDQIKRLVELKAFI